MLNFDLFDLTQLVVVPDNDPSIDIAFIVLCPYECHNLALEEQLHNMQPLQVASFKLSLQRIAHEYPESITGAQGDAARILIEVKVEIGLILVVVWGMTSSLGGFFLLGGGSMVKILVVLSLFLR